MLGPAFSLALAVSLAASQSPSPTVEDVPRLIAQMKASYDTNSWRAVYAFGQIGRPAVPALIAVLSDRTLPSMDKVKEPARYQAAFALEKIGPPAAEAVPLLLAILADQSEDEGVRWACASALGSIGARPDEVVPALMKVLEEPRALGSTLAGYVVGALASFARQRDARPALRDALPDLKRAHARMGPSGSFATILRELEPPTPDQLAEEDEIRVLVVRHQLGNAREMWCIHTNVSDTVFARLAGLKVTRVAQECRSTDPTPPPESNRLPVTRRWLTVDTIDWISRDRVFAQTVACLGFLPCFETHYELERRNGEQGGWNIVSEYRPPAL